MKSIMEKVAKEIKVMRLNDALGDENVVKMERVLIIKPNVIDEAICSTLYFNLSTNIRSFIFLMLK